MTLSIITICFNDLAGLRKTVSELRQQSSFDFEHYIVDGNSADGTKEFLASLEVPWKLKFVSEPDAGLYDAMNKGTRLASGDYVWFLNSGDFPASNGVIAKLNAELKSKSDTDLLYGLTWVDSSFGRRSSGKEIAYADFFTGMPVCHQSIIYGRRHLLKSPYPTQYKYIADWVVTADLFKSGLKSVYVPEYISVFDQSGMSSRNHFLQFKERLAYESNPLRKAGVVFFTGGRFFLIWLTKKLGIYKHLKIRQHARSQSS